MKHHDFIQTEQIFKIVPGFGGVRGFGAFFSEDR